MPAPAALYGADLAGVQAILTYRTIDGSSDPTDAQVTTWVVEGAARVFAKVGSLSELPDSVDAALGGDSIRGVATKIAKHAAELYAAGITEGAGLPELARPNDVSGFAGWLMAQYESAIADLIVLVDRETAGAGVPPDEGSPVLTRTPAYSVPPIVFPDNMRF